MKFQSHRTVTTTFLSGVLTGVWLLGALEAAGAEPDPCALVPKAEAEKILGELKDAPKADTGLQKEKTCDYTTMSGSWLKVSLYTSDRWGMQKGIVIEMNPTDIAGLGEEAFSV